MVDLMYSIITPVYNRHDCILRCMESVSSQINTNIGIEHIIVDDGSTDDTYSIIKEYALKHPHIRHYKFNKNKGTNAARNHAISNAKGVFCILLDSDDYFTPDAIEYIEKTREDSPDYSHYLFTPDDRKEQLNSYCNSNQLQREFEYIDFLSGSISGDFIHIVKTEIFNKYPFLESVRIQEHLTFLKIYREEGRLLFTNHIVTIRERKRHDSVTKETLRIDDKRIRLNKEGIEYYLKNYKDDLKKYHFDNILKKNYVRLFENMLLLSQYDEARNLLSTMYEENIHLPSRMRVVYLTKTGWLYKNMLKFYLKWKYRNW